jgi:signal transduction histidine kinase
MMPQPTPDRTGERGLRALFALLALVVPLLIGYDVYFQSTTGALDGSIDRETGLVTHVAPHSFADWAGLTPGDVIISVAGTPFSEWQATAPGNYHIEVQRRGRRLTLELPVVPLIKVNTLSVVSGVATALTFWSVGTVLLWRRFRRPDVRLLFLLMQTLAVAALFLLAHPEGTTRPWMTRLGQACFQLATPLLLHHAVIFPVRLGPPRRRRRLLTLAYALTAVGIASTWVLADAWTRLILAITALELLAIGGLLFYVYVRHASADDRRRLRLITFGNLAAGIPTILLYILPHILRRDWGPPLWTASFFMVLAPSGYLLAIVHHNLFDIDRLLNRAVVYGILSLGILLLYLGPFLLIYRAVPDDLLAQLLVVSALTLLVGLAFDWSKMRVQQLVDQLFYGGWYDYPGVVETVSAELARSLDRHQLTAVLAEQVPALMRLHPGRLHIGEKVKELEPDPKQPHLWFDLAFEGRLAAVWVVGPHRDGEDFTAADRRILRTLADQAETALRNVLLVEALRRRLEEIRASRETLARAQHRLLLSREEERARLARELHDSPIQSLVGLNLQLGLLRNVVSAGDAANPTLARELQAMRAEVRALLAELRAVCAALRPPMLDTLGLAAALRALAEEWSAQHAIPLDLTLPNDEQLSALPEAVAVNLYRVTQEALTNVARHAEAESAALRMTADDGRLTLTIRDDGRGFPTPNDRGARTANDHFGLIGIQERVELIGGTLEIASEPGRGTTIRVDWAPPA